MAKRKAFLHIGLGDGSGDFVDAALEHHDFALAELGVRRLARSSDESHRAALEILRQHKAWGYRRSEVEGAWSAMCRRGRKGRDTLVLSQPLLAPAEPDQIELLFDGLAGFERHVIITVAAPDAWTMVGEPDRDLGAVLDRWGSSARKPERVHLVVAPPGGGRKKLWKSLGKVIGFGTSSLGLDDLPKLATPTPHRPIGADRLPMLHRLAEGWIERVEAGGYDVVGDLSHLLPATEAASTGQPEAGAPGAEFELMQALREIQRLTRRNATLEERLAEATGRRTVHDVA